MNVLFVCTGNTCRSSMAEALFKDILKEKVSKFDEVKVNSAGIFAINDMAASPQAVIAMENRGIDLTKHKSRLITKQMIEDADLILTMTERHKDSILEKEPDVEEKVYTLKEYVSEGKETSIDIIDPFGQPVEVYIRTADEIKEALIKVLERIKLNTDDNITDK